MKKDSQAFIWLIRRDGPVQPGLIRAMIIIGQEPLGVRSAASQRAEREEEDDGMWLDPKQTRLMRLGQADRHRRNQVLMLHREGAGLVDSQPTVDEDQETALDRPTSPGSAAEFSGAGVAVPSDAEESQGAETGTPTTGNKAGWFGGAAPLGDLINDIIRFFAGSGQSPRETNGAGAEAEEGVEE